MTPLSARQKTMIVNSVKKAIKTGNIEHLSNTAYKFVSLSSGFIAHYNLLGFRDAYANTQQLKSELISNQTANQWGNFRPGEKNYEYYKAKAEVYNAIVAAIK